MSAEITYAASEAARIFGTFVDRSFPASNTMATTTGSKMADEYVVTLARISAAAEATIQRVKSRTSVARTAHQAERATRNRDIASKVANAPSFSVGPSKAHRRGEERGPLPE